MRSVILVISLYASFIATVVAAFFVGQAFGWFIVGIVATFGLIVYISGSYSTKSRTPAAPGMSKRVVEAVDKWKRN